MYIFEGKQRRQICKSCAGQRRPIGECSILIAITFSVCLMVLNATFNNISIISWRSVLFEETGGPEKTTDMSQVTDKLYHMKIRTHNIDHCLCLVPVVLGDHDGCMFNNFIIIQVVYNLVRTCIDQYGKRIPFTISIA